MKALFRFVQLLRWRRGVVAGVLVALASFITLNALLAKVEGDARVVACVRAVAAGAKVAEADVALVRLPTELVPESGFTAVSDVVGKVAATGLVPRQVVTANSLVLGQSAASDGQAIVPITVSEQVRPLLFVGGRVDISSLGETGKPELLVEEALVVALPEVTTTGFGGGAKPVVLVQVPKGSATLVAHNGLTGRLGVAMR